MDIAKFNEHQVSKENINILSQRLEISSGVSLDGRRPTLWSALSKSNGQWYITRQWVRLVVNLFLYTLFRRVTELYRYKHIFIYVVIFFLL